MECGSEASAHAEANASALQTGQRAAPLFHSVGEGLGVRATKMRTPPHAANSSDVPLSDLKEGVAIIAIFYELWLCNWYDSYQSPFDRKTRRDDEIHLRGDAE